MRVFWMLCWWLLNVINEQCGFEWESEREREGKWNYWWWGRRQLCEAWLMKKSEFCCTIVLVSEIFLGGLKKISNWKIEWKIQEFLDFSMIFSYNYDSFLLFSLKILNFRNLFQLWSEKKMKKSKQKTSISPKIQLIPSQLFSPPINHAN